MHESRTLRGKALHKLALLSASSTSSQHKASDLGKLCSACPATQSPTNGASNGASSDPSATGRIPMNIRELEVLLALCEAAPSVNDPSNAARLLQQIAPYVAESCYQAIAPSPFLGTLKPSPWETLTSSLVNALLKLGLRHTSMRERVKESLFAYTENCSRFASHFSSRKVGGDDINSTLGGREILGISTLTLSLLGFLGAASKNAHFWTAEERSKLVQDYQSILSEGYLIAVEATFSTIRNSSSGSGDIKEWKHYLKHYAGAGRPLGAMLLRQAYMEMVLSCAALLVHSPTDITGPSIVSLILSTPLERPDFRSEADDVLIESLVNIASREIVQLEEGSDYLQLGSAWQQRIAQSVKASSLATFLCCSLANEDLADPDVLMLWLEASLADPTQVADLSLISVVLRSLAVMATTSVSTASKLSRSIPRFLVQKPLPSETASIAAISLLSILRRLPQDTVITTLYSLGNSLSAGNGTDTLANYALFNEGAMDNTYYLGSNGHLSVQGSSLNLVVSNSEQDSSIYNAVILAIVTVARGFGDETITALALSMLVQKVGKVNMAVDLKIIAEAAVLAAEGGVSEFRALLRLYLRLGEQAAVQNDGPMLRAVAEARDYLSRTLKAGTELCEVYLQHLLETIISKGDAPPQRHNVQHVDVESGALEISMLLRPLSLLVASNAPADAKASNDIKVESFPALQRDAWYNMVVHGFSTISPLGRKYAKELKILARHGHPLIAEERADRLESDVELNTVLRRGMNSENTSAQMKDMVSLLPFCESDIRSLSYPELMFLKAAHLVETLRASNGECTKILQYFVDPKLRGSPLGNCMTAVAVTAIDGYLAASLSGSRELYSAPYVARQLASVFENCCHRVAAVQQASYACAEKMITQVPSALCQRTSLFAMLDLLTIMWASCLESETEEYEWKSSFMSPQGTTSVQLSDNYGFRKYTLRTFHRRVRDWIGRAINIAPLDIKGLLQTYLSDYGDEEAFGHMSLGRSFAFEMGAMIPVTDQRLGAIEAEDQMHINTASDFMAQYTTRQEYRYNETTRLIALDGPGGSTGSSPVNQEKQRLIILESLVKMEHRLNEREHVAVSEIRDALRRAATILCNGSGDFNTILALFVRIPFLAFTKQAVKVGLSLWIGVIKENPRMESRILVEIVECWIMSVHTKRGMFSARLHHLDPFFVKEEFAPSDKDATLKQQQRAHDLIAPHYRVLQFITSHYAATRLSSPNIEKAYYRLLKATFNGLRQTTSHPLAREVHFHILLLGSRFLRYSTSISVTAQWRLKDDLLSAGLAWFANPPRWSFGGNRLQVKAESNLLVDAASALQNISHIGARATAALRSLIPKEELLQALISNEHARLMVWLNPLDHEKKHHHHGAGSVSLRSFSDDAVSKLVATAWQENSSIAIHMIPRYQSHSIASSVRQMLLESPESAVEDPDAIPVLLGAALPTDVTSQLKYLMYWAPVNPITAVAFFLPAYGNHPCIIQYAVRALESHSVDVTFFYVPQIVQTLRYDSLGYVERYIIETAKFSQLFAHQIIWNMKANAFKDEDSQIPDPVKPTLDKVMDALISSFSGPDRDFYEREFAFFNEVTGISGKLRPFIKKSKPEKKLKIEEELRKIQVDVGVYLPSNPDGVVIGIDRKSGKPLQSHAKAPYMATFRIQKEKVDDMEVVEEQLDKVNTTGAENQSNTYEVWQSAIFKVGDDCRQDVLALQLIAAFRGIFHYVGLPVYVFPYRVTATAPGCGVIDVLPNSISRDMLGREAVNGLYEWFISKFGGEDAPAFQVARANFVKSLAAYSVISFLLQFKDRHNGNIMFDDQGHILHIDFGFCFDIAPGGVRFERAPFKLTKEMIAVMGGSHETQSFRWFEELCVKAFLASRPFVDTLSHLVVTMLDSGLPCFKPETVQHFRERFVLEKSEREAAEFMRGLVRKSYGSYSTKGYDQFQLLTNGIPY